jgi:hypothetical protein
MPTPAENKKKSVRKPRKRQGNPRIVPIIVIVGVLAVAAFIIYTIAQSPQTVPLTGLEQFTVVQGHQEGTLTYEQIPPAGGIHSGTWMNCGVYEEPIPNEKAVHSMEHGAVWITYQPDLAAAEVEKLQTLTRTTGYRLLSPYPGLPSPIVVSAWGYQLKLENADDPRLLSFIIAYQQNPRGPEPGAPCTGGEGSPG